MEKVNGESREGQWEGVKDEQPISSKPAGDPPITHNATTHTHTQSCDTGGVVVRGVGGVTIATDCWNAASPGKQEMSPLRSGGAGVEG